MIIIYGRRACGRVEAHGGELAQTTFVHVYYVPLIPIGSFWATHEAGGSRIGHSIPLHGPSVLAAYLRGLAPLLAVAVLAATDDALAGGAIAGVLAAMSIGSWTRRSVRGELAQAQRRSPPRVRHALRSAADVAREPQGVDRTAHGSLGAIGRGLRAERRRYDRRADTRRGRAGVRLLRLSAAEHGGADEAAAAERIFAVSTRCRRAMAGRIAAARSRRRARRPSRRRRSRSDRQTPNNSEPPCRSC